MNKINSKKTSLFIVGAPKSGTTALASYLEQHPNVYMLPKEVHFFGSDLEFRRPLPTLARYESMCEKAPEGSIVGDASVYYLYSKTAATEIYEWSNDASVIIQLRNPVDMVHSLHQQLIASMHEDIRDFSDALAAEPDRKMGERIPFTAHPVHALYYKDIAQYPEQIRRYWSVFGKERVKIIIFDDFINNTEKIYDEVLDFVGLEKHHLGKFDIVNSTTDIRFPLLKIFEKKCLSVEGFAHLHMPEFLYRKIISSIYKITSKPAEKTPMNQCVRQELKEHFSDLVEELSDMLGRDLGSWVKV